MPIEVLAAALEECLGALAQGASLEQVLARYPQQAYELRPLLTAAPVVRSMGRLAPAPASAARSRARLVAETRRAQRTRPAGFVLLPRMRTALSSQDFPRTDAHQPDRRCRAPPRPPTGL